MDALEVAQEELGNTMMPHPDEFMEDYSPQAALLFGRQVAMSCLRISIAAARSLEVADTEEVPTATEVLNGVSAAVVGFTHALVALGVLPQEAEDAFTVTA